MSSVPNHEQITAAPPIAPGGQRRANGIWQWLKSAAATVLIVAALAGLAAWGHFSEWKMPKFSALVGNKEAAEKEWCDEHNVAEAQCIECQPSLLPLGPDYGWCQTHGIFQCPLEHPDVAQLKTPPTITQADLDRASRALAVKPRPENNSLCPLHMRRIQFASTQAIEKAGIDVAVVQERPLVESIEANGEVIQHHPHIAPLSSRVSGTDWRVEKEEGDRVQPGDCLAIIDAAEVGKAKTELLQAIAQVRLKQAHVDRARSLGEGVLPLRQFRESETAWQEAKIRLHSAQQSLVNLGLPVKLEPFDDLDTAEIARRIHFLGLPDEIANSLDANTTTANLFPIRSPQEGIVIERHAVVGEVVDTKNVLFEIADVGHMWLILNVREDDAKYLALDQTVIFTPSSNRNGAEIRGSVSLISTASDVQTRTVKVRVELPNPEGRLRANTFGTGRIVLREEPRAIVVPTESIHWDGNCHVVFVRDRQFHEEGRPKFFYVRGVRLGVKEADQTEIIAGLLPGEVVATKNSVVLQAQLLKSQLGEGEGGHHHH